MKQKSCPNCGAPYDIVENKCPYCGTCYFDMSCLDLSGHEPFYLKIKYPYGDNNFYITQKVVPDLSQCGFEQERDDVYASGGRCNAKLFKITRSVTLNTNLSFKAIPDKDILCTLEKE